MSFPRAKETMHDPFKAWYPTFKANEVFSMFKKTILAIFVVVSISLVFYSAISNNIPCYKNDIVFLSNNLRYNNINVLNNTKETTNLSHIIFGIGGSAATWNERRHYSELWWRANTTRGYVWLDEKLPLEDDKWSETSPPYRVSENTSRFLYKCSYGSRSAIRVARIIKETFELGLDNVRWFVMGDDDTVFFLDNLVMILRKYDHNQMYYIGGNSESVEQDVIHSYTMAYGGGGFAVSYPLAKELVGILDGCIDRYAKFYGSDQKVHGCISEIGVPLTKELGFHQFDIRGDPYGLLAAHPIAPLVSLHHLDTFQSIFPEMTQIDSLKNLVGAYKMDPGRALQHSLCYDLTRNWSVSVSWGYTVQIYSSLRTSKELETAFLTFQTWRSSSNGPFTFNTRPVSADPCEKPVVFFMDRVESLGENGTLSTYKMFAEESQLQCKRPDYAPILAVQLVNVTASTLSSDVWTNMAPRRQCCEIIRDGNETKSVVQVKIRGCNPFESVTPP